MMGRAAMSLDLQAVTGGLQSIMSGGTRNPATAAFVADNMRLVDNYIKVRQCRGGSHNGQDFTSSSASTICWVDMEHSIFAEKKEGAWHRVSPGLKKQGWSDSGQLGYQCCSLLYTKWCPPLLTL